MSVNSLLNFWIFIFFLFLSVVSPQIHLLSPGDVVTCPSHWTLSSFLPLFLSFFLTRSYEPRLALNSLCRQWWPYTDLLASTSQIIRLEPWATMLAQAVLRTELVWQDEKQRLENLLETPGPEFHTRVWNTEAETRDLSSSKEKGENRFLKCCLLTSPFVLWYMHAQTQ